MRQLVLAAAASLILMVPASFAQDAPDSDEIVRLPGQGMVKSDDFYSGRAGPAPKKLVPGGGLIISFDANQDGTVTAEELSIGADAAFQTADANQDGDLTALEQQAWAQKLPTRDDTLTNPLRFNPNLDRSVSLEEFVSVVTKLAGDYSEGANGAIQLAALEAHDTRPEKRPVARRPKPNRLQR